MRAPSLTRGCPGGDHILGCNPAADQEPWMQAVSFQTDDYEQAVETFCEKGWSDGLHVVLPTRKLVEAMVAAGGRDRNENLGPIGPKNHAATVEMLAINSVMGGCKPEYF